MEKETLEETAENKYPIENTGAMFMPNRHEVTNIYRQEGFIAGAKWQAERMYSEEDMIEFAKWVFLEVGSNTGKDRTNQELFNEWSEQFKKK